MKDTNSLIQHGGSIILRVYIRNISYTTIDSECHTKSGKSVLRKWMKNEMFYTWKRGKKGDTGKHCSPIDLLVLGAWKTKKGYYIWWFKKDDIYWWELDVQVQLETLTLLIL